MPARLLLPLLLASMTAGQTYIVDANNGLRITASSAPPGGVVSATVTSDPGDFVITIVGLPGSPQIVSGFVDAFWLDPGVTSHSLTVHGGVPVVTTLTIPAVPSLVGLQLVWHAACFGAAIGAQNTAPAISSVLH